MALRDIKDKITSVQKTAKVTKAMESVSAVKMRRAQEEAIMARPYTHSAFTILKRLSQVSKINLDQMYDFHKRDQGRTCVVLVTSSKGLAGALNTNIFKKLQSLADELSWTPSDTDFICIGKKGKEYASRTGYNIMHNRDAFDEDETGHILEEIADMCHKLFHAEGYKEIRVVYTSFITTTEQQAVSRLILPIKYQELHDFIHEIIPRRGRYSDLSDADLDAQVDWKKEYTFEPEVDQLIEDLVPHLMYIGLYHALLESKASEHSARMIAMKNATDKAMEVETELSRQYNKARQAVITQEISEIIGGMETV